MLIVFSLNSNLLKSINHILSLLMGISSQQILIIFDKFSWILFSWCFVKWHSWVPSVIEACSRGSPHEDTYCHKARLHWTKANVIVTSLGRDMVLCHLLFRPNELHMQTGTNTLFKAVFFCSYNYLANVNTTFLLIHTPRERDWGSNGS